MDMLDFDFDFDSKYLIACTYGPDSMALLDLMQLSGVKPIVCFVNYHTDDSMESEEGAMREYCNKKTLTLEICDTNYSRQEGKENFGKWARDTRYDFFKRMYAKYNAAALFIAHTQDDVLEAYLVQKESGSQLHRFGYVKISSYEGMIVARPLLDYTSQDILDYDKAHNVPYSEHMSHYEDVHTRNRIRAEVISKLNEIEREQILDEMNKVNIEKISLMSDISKTINEADSLNIREIIALNEDEFTSALIHFVSKAPVKISLSAQKIADIRKMCLSASPNVVMKLKGNVFLIKEYDIITLGDNPEVLPYTYTLDKPGILNTPTFSLDFSNGAEDRNIHAEDYPLTIRTALPGDTYNPGGYLLPIRRMFIDASMPERLRRIWPVFISKTGKIIYVPRYRKSFKEYHTSVLKIFVKDDER